MFDALVRRYGAPDFATPLSPSAIDGMAGHLPDDLLAFWRQYGVGMWLGGKFQFCQPSEYAPVVERVFAGDREFAPASTHVVGFSAFGELLVWSEQHERLLVDLVRQRVRVPQFDARAPGDADRFPIATPLSRLDREGSFDVFEQTKTADPLFARARSRLGTLAMGECYGFVPALPIGGSATLDKIQRLDALTHLTFLADLGRCSVMVIQSVGGDAVAVRKLGA